MMVDEGPCFARPEIAAAKLRPTENYVLYGANGLCFLCKDRWYLEWFLTFSDKF